MYRNNNLKQNEYEIIIILFKVTFYFLFIKESTQSIDYCRANFFTFFLVTCKNMLVKIIPYQCVNVLTTPA